MNAPSFRVDGKVALITGAGRGIGLAIAQALAASGAAVAIQDIDQDVAANEVRAISAQGARALALGGDISDLSVCEKLVQQTVEQLGPIDILVNNAAIQVPEHWMATSLDSMKKQFDADLLAPILLSKLVIPRMKEKKWGRIINLGSIQQRGGNTHMLPYSLSKAAIDKLTKALARDVAKDQITVNCIAPGWINTWRNRNEFKSDEEIRDKGKHVPIGRIGQPDDFMGIALLLCSEAGSYITGQTIFVDGGMSAW